MEFKQIERKAMEVSNLYDELNRRTDFKVWGISERTQGLVGDIGDLVKLVMAKENYRGGYGNPEELNSKISHELADCLWSIITITNILEIDLEKALLVTMVELEDRIRKA